MSDGLLILLAGALLALGIGASLIAGRLRVPGLVLFLGLGMVLGSDVTGLVTFGDSMADVELARTIGIVALALILFEGGLAAGWDEIRPVIVPSVALALIGTIVTAVIVGLAASWLLDLDTEEGLLLGSIVAATDGAAVFSVLRGSSIPRRLARLLEGESGLNDPVAIVLVLGLIEVIDDPSFGIWDMIALGVQELAIAVVVGVVVGRLAIEGFRRAQFGTSGLYPVASIATAALSFGVADVIAGSGFLSVYLTGLAMGSGQIPARRTVADFHDGLAWVSQIAVFFTLGLLVFPSEFGGIAGEALLVAAVLMFAARPLAALLATMGARFRLSERLLLGWAGLRGAVPIVLATFPVLEGVPNAESFFNIVFFVVLTSTLIQGVTFEPLSRALGLSTEEPALPRPLLEVGTIRQLGAEVFEFPVGENDAVAGRLVNELGLPREALVNVIVRGEQALLPRGSTTIKGGDRLHILVRQQAREEVEGLFERWRDGPIGVPEPVELRIHGRTPIFTVQPWKAEFGEPERPESVDGIPVARQLRVRRGHPGALVQLEDGRFAVSGDGRVAAGGPRQLFRYCRERIHRAEDPAAVAWWQEVAGILSQRVVS
ncbi:MAG TPA: potassium/proton antiporter [Thermoleophilaceae bacterium]|nr:potassium/proton antiporter [Thermoleophilaceae bacterium]